MIVGGSPISPPIARYLLRRFRDGERGEASGQAQAATEPEPDKADATPTGAEDIHLSAREHEVLSLAVRGFAYREIAELLGVSAHTVTTHVRRIYRKLSVRAKSEAIYEALQLGIVKLDD